MSGANSAGMNEAMVIPDLAAANKIFRYDPVSGIIVRLSRFSTSGSPSRNGFIGANGYIMFKVDRKTIWGHRLAWMLMTGSWPKQFIDHVNRIKTDNRWCNLREASRSQNAFNCEINRLNTSGFRGVSWDSDSSRWLARIRINNKRITLGRFKCKAEAVFAFRDAAKLAVGDFASVLRKPL